MTSSFTEQQILLADSVLSESGLPLPTVKGKGNPELEQADDGAWIRHYFPERFSRPFLFYQKDFWNWVKDIPAEGRIRPRVECEPRGAGKSTSARGCAVQLLAQQKKKYVLYVCATDAQAQKHFNAIRSMLESEKLLEDYPHLLPKHQKHRPNVNSSWSSDQLVTKDGRTVEFISLLSNARGFTTEEGSRPDLVIFDDIDDSKDSAYLVQKKLDILRASIIPAKGENTLFLFAQNLIHRESVCQQVLDGRADILNDRIFVGAFPLCKEYEAERRPVEGDTTGAMEWKLTHFVPVDDGITAEYVEGMLNDIGRDAFDRECQQDVFKVDSEADFREWSEIHHVITESEFRSFFEQYGQQVWSEERNRLQIPDRWNVGMGFDNGTTQGHPSCVAFIARPPEIAPLNNSFFVFAEICMPKYPPTVGDTPELVSPGRVALAIKDVQKQWNVSDSQIQYQVMSHEASSTLNTMAIDLKDDIKLYFDKWKAAKGSGVSQIQNYLEIDHSKSHPFREGITGRPRLFFIVPDDQGRLIEGEFGQTLVAQPKDSDGFARARYEIPIYNHRNTGKAKIDDDFVDAIRGLANVFMVGMDTKTKAEVFEDEMQAKGLDKKEIIENNDLSLMQARIIEERRFAQEQRQKRSNNTRRGVIGIRR